MTATLDLRRPPAIGPRAVRMGAALLSVSLLAAVGFLALRGAAPPAGAVPAPAPPYGALPVTFVANAGQSDAHVRYLAQGGGYSFFFTDRGVTISLARGERGVALDLGFAGANPHPRVVAAGASAGTVNYLGAGRNASLPAFSQLVYQDVWPGIDVAFRGDRGNLKYEFHVAPGADPRAIALAYRGSDGLKVTAAGALAVQTPLGTLTDSAPVSYQERRGGREPVWSAYRLQGNGYGFALPGGYDHTRPLVIDPGLAYSTFLGSNTTEFGDIAVDGQGNAYVTGMTYDATFPTTTGVYQPSKRGATDAFVAKLAPDGASLLYATYLGGSAGEIGRGIAIDAQGAAYVVGETGSTDFPTAGSGSGTTAGGATDVFVSKLTPNGSVLDYSTYIGAAQDDFSTGIAVDKTGAAYITGWTESPAYPTTPGAYDTTPNGNRDAFVTKFAPSGSVAYSSFLGGTGHDQGYAIAVDGAGSAYVAGGTNRTASPTPPYYPATPGAFATSGMGISNDAFVTKLTPSGGGLAYSTYLPGTGHDDAFGIAVNAQGEAYVAGETQSSNYPITPAAYDTTLNGGSADAFVSKLNAAGSALVYSTFLGGGGWDSGRAIALDSSGAAYLTGYTESPNFPTTADGYDTTHNGAKDAFVTKLNAFGSAIVHSTFLGGALSETSGGIAVDSQGAAYVVGSTNSPTYPTTAGALDTSFSGSNDPFVTKIGGKPTAVAGGLQQLPGAAGCVVMQVPPGGCTSAQNLGSLHALAVSPDGRHLYALGTALTVFERNQQTGTLVQKTGAGMCFAHGTVSGCTTPWTGVDSLAALAITPDGGTVYVADFAEDSITTFTRNAGTGALTVAGVITSATMDGPSALVVSADGQNLYAAGATNGTVTGFTIGAGGALAPVPLGPGGPVASGCVSNGGAVAGCSTGRAMVGPAALEVSPDGRAVYVASRDSQSVNVLLRGGPNGVLKQATGATWCLTQSATPDCTTVPELGDVRALTASPGGGELYAAVSFSGRVLTFDVGAGAGDLASRPAASGCLVSDSPFSTCALGRAFTTPTGLAVTHDGFDVYAAGKGVVELDRGLHGTLTPNPAVDGCWTAVPVTNCSAIHGLGNNSVNAVAISPDDRFLYTPDTDGQIAVFRRDTTPIGAQTTTSGPVGGTVPPTLSLQLGPPAAFGAFTPGVTRDYTASMAATVTSTAADALLTVFDGSGQATGHLVNGAFSLPSTLQMKADSPAGTSYGYKPLGGAASPTPLLLYGGPVSNDPVNISMLQHVEATDALRTGAYGKTLTFTLSTATP